MCYVLDKEIYKSRGKDELQVKPPAVKRFERKYQVIELMDVGDAQ